MTEEIVIKRGILGIRGDDGSWNAREGSLYHDRICYGSTVQSERLQEELVLKHVTKKTEASKSIGDYSITIRFLKNGKKRKWMILCNTSAERTEWMSGIDQAVYWSRTKASSTGSRVPQLASKTNSMAGVPAKVEVLVKRGTLSTKGGKPGTFKPRLVSLYADRMNYGSLSSSFKISREISLKAVTKKAVGKVENGEFSFTLSYQNPGGKSGKWRLFCEETVSRDWVSKINQAVDQAKNESLPVSTLGEKVTAGSASFFRSIADSLDKSTSKTSTTAAVDGHQRAAAASAAFLAHKAHRNHASRPATTPTPPERAHPFFKAPKNLATHPVDDMPRDDIAKQRTRPRPDEGGSKEQPTNDEHQPPQPPQPVKAQAAPTSWWGGCCRPTKTLAGQPKQPVVHNIQ